jgi:hypothetical protein
MGSLWKWIAAPLEMEEGVKSDEDSRRVVVMLGRPIKEDLRDKQKNKHDREINPGE